MLKALEKRKLILSLSKQSSGQLLETLVDEQEFGLVEEFIFQKIRSGSLPIAEILNVVSSRLHRDVTPAGRLRFSTFIASLAIKYEELGQFVVHTLNTFPDLFIPVTLQLISSRKFEILHNGLEYWCKSILSSHKLSKFDYLRHGSDILIFTIQVSGMYLPSFVRLLATCFADDIIMCLNLLQNLLVNLEMKSYCLNDDTEFCMAIAEFLFEIKCFDPKIDCSHILKMLKCVHPLCSSSYALVFSHPVFNLHESITALSLCKDSIDGLVKFGSLMVLADYPSINKENETIIAQIVHSKAETFVVDSISSIRNRSVKLIHELCVTNDFNKIAQNFTANDSGDEEEFLYGEFIVLSYLIFTENETKHFKRLCELVRQNSDLAQRLLFFISVTLQNCRQRSHLVDIVNALFSIINVDAFCRDKAVAMLRKLINSSYAMRSLILPLASLHIKQESSLLDLVIENLPALIFSNNSNEMGQISYAITLRRLVEHGDKQSTLNIVFSAIQGIFRGKDTGKLKDFFPKTLAILLDCLKNLVEIRYISPKLVWKEILHSHAIQNTEAMVVFEYLSACCQVAACVAVMIPVDADTDSFEALDAVVCDVLEFFDHNVESNAVAIFSAYLEFPNSFLLFRGISLIDLFNRIITKFPLNDSELDLLQRTATRWIDEEVSAMSRSLFLGTSKVDPTLKRDNGSQESKDYQESVKSKINKTWSTNPIYAIVRMDFEIKSVDEFIHFCTELTCLPSLAQQHWIVRFEFIRKLSEMITRFLSQGIRTDEEYHNCLSKVTDILKERMLSGQTVQSVSYSVILYSFIMDTSARIESNIEKRFLEIKNLINGSLMNSRFANNEDVQALLIFGLNALSEGCPPSSEFFRDYLDSLKPKENSWLWIAKEAVGNHGSWAYHLYKLQGSITCTDPMSNALKKIIEQGQNEDSIPATPEPASVSGIFAYSLGLACGRNIPNFKWIVSQANTLTSPGPAMLKLTNCYAIAGCLKSAVLPKSNVKVLRDILSKASVEVTDARLSSWLVLLLYTASSCFIEEDVQVSKVDHKVSAVNRFGLDSPLGSVIDIIYKRKGPATDFWIKTLACTKVLPKMDWSFILQKKDALPPAELDRFAWRHFLSKTTNSVLIDKALFEFVFGLVEQGGKIPEDRFKDLIEAVSSEKSFSNRLLNASGPFIFKHASFLKIFADSSLSSFDENEIRELLFNNCDADLTSIKKIVKKVPDLTQVSLWKFVRNGDCLLGMELLFGSKGKDFEIVARVLSDQEGSLLELANILVLSMDEDIPGNVEVLLQLMSRIILSKSPAFVSALNDGLALAWICYHKSNFMQWSKVQRKISKIISLLNSDNEIVKLTQIY